MGLWAAGNVITTRTAETTRIVHGGNSYASWPDWQRLRSSHGWQVIDAGTYSLGSDPATIRTQTCGTLQAFYDHGFTDAWGMYAYPSGVYNATAAPIINSCFAYARVYGGTLNTGPNIQAPYSIRAESLDGGNCNLAGQPCSNIFKRNYDSPAIVTRRLTPGPSQWGLVQFYHLVTGSPAAQRHGTGLGLHQLQLALPLVDPGRVLLCRRLLQRRPGRQGQLGRQRQRCDARAGGAGLGSWQPQRSLTMGRGAIGQRPLRTPWSAARAGAARRTRTG